ncbi:MAG: hypothetical protein K2N34_15785 [Lachnospiraceae bacterium]|nr:hypothetical protein [Lachnospiraceae bacterium]
MSMQITNSYVNAYTYFTENNAGKTSAKKNTNNEQVNKEQSDKQVSSKSSETEEYFKNLQQKNPKLNIMSGYPANVSAKQSVNRSQKIDVTIAPNILEKMASDSETAAKWEKALAGIPAAYEWSCAAINAMTGSKMLYMHYWIDENGNMGACSASGPSPDEVGRMIADRKKEQDEQLEELIEKRKAKREEMEQYLKGETEVLPHKDVYEKEMQKLMSIDLKI